jgi:hypothetical protein
MDIGDRSICAAASAIIICKRIPSATCSIAFDGVVAGVEIRRKGIAGSRSDEDAGHRGGGLLF